MKKNNINIVLICAIVLMSIALLGYTNKIEYISSLFLSKLSIIVITIIFAIIGVILIYITKYLKDKKISILNKSYKEAYEKIQMQINQANMSFFKKKEISNEILDILYMSQINGKSVQDVVGKDTKIFTNAIIYTYGANPGILYMFLSSFQYFMFYIVLIQLVTFIVRDDVNSFYSTSIGNFTILFFIIISFLFPFIKTKSKDILSYKRRSIFPYFTLFIIIPIIVASFYIGLTRLLRNSFIHIPWVEKLVNGESIIIFNQNILIIFLSVFSIILLIKYNLRKSSYDY